MKDYIEKLKSEIRSLEYEKSTLVIFSTISETRNYTKRDVIQAKIEALNWALSQAEKI